jgi:hypothetical protein
MSEIGEFNLQMQQMKRRKFQANFVRWSRQLENSRTKLLAAAKFVGKLRLQSVAIAV